MKTDKIIIIALILGGAAALAYALLAHKTTPVTAKYAVNDYLGHYTGGTTLWYQIFQVTATNYLMKDDSNNLFTYSISSIDNDPNWSLAPII